ncbi:MAG: hypothetical protein Q9226_000936 [Calogaya cf. arnoldii]
MAQQQPAMDGADVERAARLRQIQMFVGRLSTPNVEHHRRVNQRGTRESKVADKHRDSLAGWNCMSYLNHHTLPSQLTAFIAAWENLQIDDALEQGLEDINAGQSHRARLLTVLPQVQDGSSTANAGQRRGRGDFHPRGSGRGGRGGSIIGTQPVRTARRRVPIDENNSHPARRVVAPKPALPYVSKPPITPTLQLKIPALSLNPGSSDASSNSRLRMQYVTRFPTTLFTYLNILSPGKFTLVPPVQFMSGVSIFANNTTPAASLTKARNNELSIQSNQQSNISPGVAASSKPSEVNGRSAPAPVSATEQEASQKAPPPPAQAPSQAPAKLLDGDPTRSNDEGVALPPRSNAVDLLGMDIDEPDQLPIPMQLSATSHTDPGQTSPRTARRFLEQLSSLITSFPPALRGTLPAETVRALESLKVDWSRRIPEPTRDEAQHSSVLSSKPPREDRERENLPIRGRASAVRQTHEPIRDGTQQQPSLARDKGSLPSRGLASAVQQRTLAWGKDVIAGAEPGSSSFLGENISRWRFSRRRASVDSLASVESAGSSTALTERIDRLQIDESRLPLNSPAADTYATTNPFGPKPTLGDNTSGIPSSSIPAGVPTGKNPGERGTGPQLPLFLRSQVRADDPAAAIQAEFAANFPGRRSTNEPAKRPTLGGAVISQGARLVTDSNLPQQQRYPQEAGSIGNRAEQDLVRNSDSRISRKSSIASSNVSRAEFGEDRARSYRQESAGPRPTGALIAGRSDSEKDDNLPRFHPRLGNQNIPPSVVGPSPSQSHFSAARRPSRVPAGLALPSFLASMQPAADPGAAAAEQYSRGFGYPPDKKNSGH